MKVFRSNMGASYAAARGKNALLPGESAKDIRASRAAANAKAEAKASRKARRSANRSAASSYAWAKLTESR